MFVHRRRQLFCARGEKVNEGKGKSWLQQTKNRWGERTTRGESVWHFRKNLTEFAKAGGGRERRSNNKESPMRGRCELLKGGEHKRPAITVKRRIRSKRGATTSVGHGSGKNKSSDPGAESGGVCCRNPTRPRMGR